MPETGQKNVQTRSQARAPPNFEGDDMKEYIKSEVEKYFGSVAFQDSLREFITDSVKMACKNLVESIVVPIKDEIQALKTELIEVKRKCNDNEQYSRRSSVRIYGIPEGPKENCIKKVCDFFQKEMDLAFAEEDIDRTHRVGKKNRDGNRAMIVKFKAYDSKRSVMKVKKARLSNKTFSVYEDLTFLNRKLLYLARNEYKETPVWTIDGRVLVNMDGRVQPYVPTVNIYTWLQSPSS
ncbi:Hypothetical predicted protein [Paramuricea clavata]|uniref:Uncharacterized protein n=2 Tax=Paramuricea clavata TaxID=317549 RepID=A0A6S7JM55_PARCT|nr:Hypothetical predicted protein [Paramuricea clavata]